MSEPQKPSSRRPSSPSPSRFDEVRCADCGSSYIQRPGTTCPRCGGFGKSTSEDVTRKVADDNDLFKGF